MSNKSQYHELLQTTLKNGPSEGKAPPLDILANLSNEQLSKHWSRLSPEVEMFERNIFLFYKVFINQKDRQDDLDKIEEINSIINSITDIRHEVWKNEGPFKIANSVFDLNLKVTIFLDTLNKPERKAIYRELEKNDAMSIEIEKALKTIISEKEKPTAARVWQKLIELCGNPGSYCAQWRHETSCKGKNKDKPVIVWFGVQGNQGELTINALRERLRRRKQ